MSLPILKGNKGWPSILLARASKLDAGAGIEAAEAAGAWKAYRDAVGGLTPDGVIRVVSEAGLRGRGGGGHGTGSKWRACAAAEDPRRTVIANGFEADPGAQADRTLVERDPHAVLEGVAIAAFAVGADDAIIVLSSSASLAAERMAAAVREAEARGHIGRDGSGRSLNVEVRQLSGSFVLGEETVLLRALEERRAQPDQRPPYPATDGLWGRPTVVNNVKTLAAVPWILAHGAGSYASLGTPDAPGTTLVQLGGAVKKPGIAEVPLGTSVAEIVAGPGGGARKPTAVLVGGPTGGFLPPDGLDVALTSDALRDAGAVLGSGTVLVLDDRACVLDVASLMTRYLNDEACGKTIPCRIGTRRLAELGAGFCTGRARPSDADLLGDLAADVRDAALCGLERDAVNPLLSVMRYFAPEFEDHVVRDTCAAGVCQLTPTALAGAR